MERNIYLDVDTILNKEFNIDFKGYSPMEVNQFLDAVIHDYDTFERIINEKNDQLSQNENIMSQMRQRISELETKLKQAEESAANNAAGANANNLSQVDLLRRLARLENEVFRNR